MPDPPPLAPGDVSAQATGEDTDKSSDFRAPAVAYQAYTGFLKAPARLQRAADYLRARGFDPKRKGKVCDSPAHSGLVFQRTDCRTGDLVEAVLAYQKRFYDHGDLNKRFVGLLLTDEEKARIKELPDFTEMWRQEYSTFFKNNRDGIPGTILDMFFQAGIESSELEVFKVLRHKPRLRNFLHHTSDVPVPQAFVVKTFGPGEEQAYLIFIKSDELTMKPGPNPGLWQQKLFSHAMRDFLTEELGDFIRNGGGLDERRFALTPATERALSQEEAARFIGERFVNYEEERLRSSMYGKTAEEWRVENNWEWLAPCASKVADIVNQGGGRQNYEAAAQCAALELAQQLAQPVSPKKLAQAFKKAAPRTRNDVKQTLKKFITRNMASDAKPEAKPRKAKLDAATKPESGLQICCESVGRQKRSGRGGSGCIPCAPGPSGLGGHAPLQPPPALANAGVVKDFMNGNRSADDVLKVTVNAMRKAGTVQEARALFDSIRTLAQTRPDIRPNTYLYAQMMASYLDSNLPNKNIQVKTLIQDAIGHGVIRPNAGYDSIRNELNFHTRNVYTDAYSSKDPHDPGVSRHVARALLVYNELKINDKTKFVVGWHGKGVIKAEIERALPKLGTSYIVDPANPGQLIPAPRKRPKRDDDPSGVLQAEGLLPHGV